MGGNCYLDTRVALRVNAKDVISFSRDAENHVLVNVQMITRSGQERMSLVENYWISRGEPTDLECPPSGRLIRAQYSNGDKLAIEFSEVATHEIAASRFPSLRLLPPGFVPFPITAVSVETHVAGAGISLDRLRSTVGSAGLVGNFFQGCDVAIDAKGIPYRHVILARAKIAL